MAKKGSPKAPTPVDPVAIGAQQTTSNKDTAQYQSVLNNANAYSPFGSVTQHQDPTTGQWSSTTSLSPGQQQIFGANQQATQTALHGVQSNLANPLTPGAIQSSFNPGAAIETGFDPGSPLRTSFDGGSPLQSSFNQGQGVQGQVNGPGQSDAIRQAINASYSGQMGLLQPQMDQAAEHQQAQLVAQGLNPNSAAYQNSQTLFNNGQAQQRSQVAANAVQQGMNEQQALYGQDLSSSQFANQAAGQQYAQGLGAAQFQNTTAGQQYAQNLGQAQFGNAAAGQQYAQNLGQATFNNTAAGQQYGQNLGLAQFGNNAEAQQFGQQAQAQQQQLASYEALNGGAGANMPTGTGFAATSVAPTDYLGAYGLNAQQQQSNYQAKLQQQQSNMQGLYNLGSAALMFA